MIAALESLNSPLPDEAAQDSLSEERIFGIYFWTWEVHKRDFPSVVDLQPQTQSLREGSLK